MIANYHTHTWRCNHATGNETQYVENAIAAGLQILGFSDHSPYIFPEGYYSNFRMYPQQLEGYVQTVLNLRKTYKVKIEIPLGLELEYYPDLLPNLLPILKDQPLDYVILGQHFVGNEMNDHYSGTHAEDRRLLERYTNQSIDAMQTGLFTYFAHPDILNYWGDVKFYRQQARRICQEAKNCGMPLEINLLGIRNKRNYPNPLFWEMAAEEGCDVILGRDAHEPEALLQKEYEETALEMVKKLGLNLLQTVELKKL
ncbi:MAG: histidinol-phosphatase [Oscillospiraceae bacterium]|nr:histidinol-phosphatase [Oscillospiraceae bacterium]